MGISISVNTDDPVMFNCTLAGELELLATELRFSQGELLQLMRNAVDAAWCDDTTRTEILALYQPPTEVAT